MVGQDYIPTEEQLRYLEDDINEKLYPGSDSEYIIIKRLEWYNWDDDPRWFVTADKVTECQDGEISYMIEIDVWASAYNGESSPMYVDDVDTNPGHGSPCMSVLIVRLGNEGEWLYGKDRLEDRGKALKKIQEEGC